MKKRQQELKMPTLKGRTRFDILRKPQGGRDRMDKGERSRQGPAGGAWQAWEEPQSLCQEQRRTPQRARAEP